MGLDVKLDNKTNLVKTNKGISLDLHPENVEKFGGAFRIKSIPPELKIIQQGVRPSHHLLVAREPMPLKKFRELLNKVEVF